MTVRMQDVARAAGVPPATVSRVLNNNLTVNPALARRVRDTALSLEYRPNAAARSLRRRRSRVWALLVTDVSNPFFTAVARGVEDIAQKHGYSVLLCNTDEVAGKETRYLEVAEEERAAGVIIAPVGANTDIARLTTADIPVVVIDRRLDTPADNVAAASYAGARSATEHLLRMGWDRPACITGPAHAQPSADRQKRYASAITDAGLPIITEFVGFHTDNGRSATGRLLDLAVPPDSLVVTNSVLALGVLGELKRAGWSQAVTSASLCSTTRRGHRS